MNRYRVSVAKGEDSYKTTIKALENIDLTFIKGKKVLLKPNIGRALPAGSGAVTNPEVVAAIIDYFQGLGASEVAIGESPISGVRIKNAYKISGIEKVARERGVRLLDFDKETFITLPINDGLLIKKIKVSKFLKEYDIITSIPVMKTHMHTRVTLSLKNMKGILWRKQKIAFHQISLPKNISLKEKTLDIAIADMARIIYPDIAIIDGSIGMEGLGPGAGTPKKANLIIASKDALSADWIASLLMGILPEEVAHLHLIALYKRFKQDLIETIPLDFLKWKVNFAAPPEDISFDYPGIAIHDRQSCSACQNTLYLFLKKYYKDMLPYIEKHSHIHIAIGKGVKNLPEDTIYIGNCSCELAEAETGIKVPGCPPVASRIWKKISDNFF